MRIENLLSGQKVTLQVNINGATLNLETTTQKSYPQKHFVLLDAVKYNGKGISFKKQGITVDLIACFDEKPYIFKSIAILLQKKPDGSLCYFVTSDAEGISFNRRENFRCYIGVSGYMSHSSLSEPEYMIIRDISYNGFSVICRPGLTLEKGQLIHAVLHDYLADENTKFSFHLHGTVTRVQRLPSGYILFGCRLNNQVPGLDRYIMTKERHHLRKASGF